jgi:hypothetical protein
MFNEEVLFRRYGETAHKAFDHESGDDANHILFSQATNVIK